MKQRNIQEKLLHYLSIFPVVLLMGARQTGKTTLVRNLSLSQKLSFLTFDDPSLFRAAKEDPIGFLKQQSKPLIIDEVQRVPELFVAIKYLVDQEDRVGQFLLTGSANPLLLPTLSDSLAGRMGSLYLCPLSQGELFGKKENFFPWIFSENFQKKSFREISLYSLGNMIYKGGFPRVQNYSSNFDIETWIEEYLQTILSRDIKDLANIEKIYYFFDLLQLLAHRSGSLFNGSDLARTLKISTSTLYRYISLLEIIFFIFRLPAWFINHAKRVSKSPKIYISDSGILSYLLKAGPECCKTNPSLFGVLLESFVASELVKQNSFSQMSIELFHYREGSNEVDIVCEERAGKIVGVEIKSSSTIRPSDFDGLQRLKEVSKDRFLRGIILYSGSEMIPFGENFWAIPISALWEA